MAHIHDLIKQLRASDPELGDEIAREIEVLSQRRAFGLNFERHTPEAVELPGRRIRVGDKVHILPPRGQNARAENSRLWSVAAIDRDGGQQIANLQDAKSGVDAEEMSVAVDDLVFVAEFRDPIYPGLVSAGKVERGGDKPFHSVINAENYHALQALLYTHRGAVDVIYIDPPYNTGNDGWIYNDRYVSNDDVYRHSKWLAFMERRLLLAKELMKPTGVIIVAIGDEEHHRLRMLMDQVFDSRNFISDVVWQGGRKNDSRYVSNGADYMLLYARDEAELALREVRWREAKAGVDQVIAAGRRFLSDARGDAAVATASLKAWLRTSTVSIDPGTKAYENVDEHGRVYSRVKMTSPNPRPNLMYEVVHPITGKPVPTPDKGWAVSAAVMADRISQGRVSFGRDETTIPRAKQFLDESAVQNPTSVFERRRDHGSRHLVNVLGEKRFPNPKDPNVIARWLGMVSQRDAVILDFFGGSGSTAEAVMRLNNADGGVRKCILVTNNELAATDAKRLSKQGCRPGDAAWDGRGVFEYVARPRISTIVTGTREDGSSYSDGLAQNVEFFRLTYESPLRVQAHRAFERIAPLLWLRAGSRGRRIDAVPDGWDVTETYGVIDDMDKTDAFVAAMLASPEARIAFIVTDEDRFFEAIANALPEEVEVVRLYGSYLRNFEIDAMRGAR